MADLTKQEAAKIRRHFNNAMWYFEAAVWYWLPISRKAAFRCADRKLHKPEPRGAIKLGIYTRHATEEFLDDISDAIALAEARRKPAIES